MKRLIPYVLALGAVMLNACKKHDLPQPEQESSPVFYLKCQVNGVPVSIQAGINNYYMTSSHYQDKNNVYVYKGELKQTNCSNGCGYSLAVLINDYKYSVTNAPMKVDSGLVIGNYAFNDGNLSPIQYTGNFIPETVAQGGTYDWSYSDGNTASAQPTSRLFDADKTYTVTLNANSPSGCSAAHTRVFKVGNPLQTNITSVYSAGKYTFAAKAPAGLGPYTYHWEFGDGSVSNDSVPDHYYTQQNLFTTTLRLVDAHNDTCLAHYQVSVGGGCEANFNGSFVPVPNTKALSTITLLITDPNGNVFSSSDFNQPSGSSFEITSVENYMTNENNESTKKLKLRFNCSLKNNGQPLNITNGEAVIAVSYK